MIPKVYIGNLLKDKKSYLPILYPNLGRQHKPDRLFLDKAYDVLSEPVVDIVDDPNQSDYFLLPYDFFNVEKFSEYLRDFSELARKHNKQIIIFDFSAFDKEIRIPNSLIFRVSIYKNKKRSNEIVMPPFVENLSQIPVRDKDDKDSEPTVGFNGYAKFSFRNLLPLGAHRQGLYFRRKAMRLLEQASGIKTNFISRSSYAGHRDTIGMDPEVARHEYLENIRNSDFVLSPKGDGNYSIRFYETLALGRIPILIDTDNVLPLEDEIDYEKFIIRVDYRNINSFARIVKEKYESMSNDEFVAMQERAREAFENYLLMDS